MRFLELRERLINRNCLDEYTITNIVKAGFKVLREELDRRDKEEYDKEQKERAEKAAYDAHHNAGN